VSVRGVRRFVEDLLGRRSTRPIRAVPEEDAQLRTAILLSAARPGADEPSEAFVEGLRERLAEELAEPEPAPPVRKRRRVVQAASLAAASATIGAGAAHLLTRGPGQPGRTLEPSAGRWRTVAADRDLPEGGVWRFDVGGVVGFVHRVDGQVRAVSGICTHLGCRLALDAANRRLNCPCHRSAFAVTGEVLHHQLPIDLPPLPTLHVREADGQVQVFLPNEDA
jgi:cytochrome b6-f complex iron-sulfur subunit